MSLSKGNKQYRCETFGDLRRGIRAVNKLLVRNLPEYHILTIVQNFSLPVPIVPLRGQSTRKRIYHQHLSILFHEDSNIPQAWYSPMSA
jgi:hypothetical protein